jgi:predicted Zn-dependent protease
MRGFLNLLSLLLIFFAALFLTKKCVKSLKVKDDLRLGKKMAARFEQKYRILPYNRYRQAYDYLYFLRDVILKTGKITYKDELAWQFRIIQDDYLVNAFCLPGGYIYIGTGFLKRLRTEAQLLSVIAHEMAHADLRHTIKSLKREQKLQAIEDVLSNKHAKRLAQKAIELELLSYDRDQEREADAYAVVYMCSAGYRVYAMVEMLQMLWRVNGAQQPTYLSTHPHHAERIQNVLHLSQRQKCSGKKDYDNRYRQIIARLP